MKMMILMKRPLVNSPVSLAIVNPLSGSQALVVRHPVVQTGVTVQAEQQVAGCPDHSGWGER